MSIDLLSAKNVLITNIGIFLAGFAIQMMEQAIIYLLEMKPPYGYGKDILQAGLLMTPNAIAMLIIAPLVGRLMVRYGAKLFVQIGAVTAIIGLLLLSHNPTLLGLWKLVGLVVLVGAGITALNVSLINILIFSVEKRVMGIATGLNTLFRNMGAAWGPAVAGTLMSMYSITIPLMLQGRFIYIKIPKPVAYHYLFILTAIMYIALLFISLLIKEVVKMKTSKKIA